MDENTNAHIDKLTNEIVDFVRYSFLYPDEMLKVIQSSYEALDSIQSIVKCKDGEMKKDDK